MLLREPSEIPAAVAIALADFCRRAGRPSSSLDVRVALARLSPDEDRAVERLCDEAPPVRPLSPHAVIDIIRGRPAADAARLEEEGHYLEVAKQAALEAEAFEGDHSGELEDAAESADGSDEESDDESAEVEETSAASRSEDAASGPASGDAGEQEPESAAAPIGLEPAAPPKRIRKSRVRLPEPVRRPKVEVEARITAEAEARSRPQEEEDETPVVRPGRSPGTPQFGRFVGGQVAKRSFRDLETREGARTLESLVLELRGNRGSIVQRLENMYSRDDGREISEADFRRLLGRHHLDTWFEKLERENLRILLRQSRGFLPPVARTLNLDRTELQNLLRQHGLVNEPAELKERTREEARADAPLADRIAFAADKEEQLADAGALSELDERNRDELEEVVEDVIDESAGREPHVAVELARRSLGIDPRIWRKALKRYSLLQFAATRLGVELPPQQEEARPERKVRSQRPGGRPGGRPGDKPGNRPGGMQRGPGQGQQRGFSRERPGSTGGGSSGRPFEGARPQRTFTGDRPARPFDRSGGDRPARTFDRSGGDRPARPFDRSGGDRPARPFDRSGGDRPARPFDRAGGDRPARPFDRAGGERPARPFDRAGGERPARPSDRSGSDRPARPFSSDRPQRSFSSDRPFDRSGKPPSRGPRPASGKPGRPQTGPRKPGGPGGGKKSD